MAKNIKKALAKRYGVLFALLALFFVFILLTTKVSGKMFVNIIGTLVLLALIPFAIMAMLKKQAKKSKHKH